MKRFNQTSTIIAAVGGAAVVAGVNLYKHAKGSKSLDGKERDEQELLASILFIGGWLTIAYTIAGGRTNVFQRIESPKVFLPLLSAGCIVAGAMMLRKAMDKESQEGTEVGQMLFLGGWAGILYSMTQMAGGQQKTMASVAAVGTTLLGVYLTGDAEKKSADQHVGKSVFAFGWILMALAIGFRG